MTEKSRYNKTLVTLNRMEINKIIQWNCRGIQSRYEELKALINEENPKIICLQEVQLKVNTFKLGNTYKKHTHTALGANRAKGGVMVAVKTNIGTKIAIEKRKQPDLLFEK